LSYIVAKDDIKNAYSLYASASQIARVVGPMLGGAMLLWVSPFWIFLFTCAMYLFVILFYSQMNTEEFILHKDSKNTDSKILDSLKYIWHSQTMRDLVVIGLFLAIFFWSYTTYFPIMVKTMFNNNVLSFSLLMAAYAIGNILGNLYSASHKDVSYRHIRHLLIAFSLFGILFALVTNLWVSLFIALASGSLSAQLNTITNSLVRTNAEDKYLGTVMSMWLVITVGTTAFGSIYYGYIADLFGIQIALLAPPIIFLLFSIFYFGKVR
jgi:MFS family permease